MWENLDGTRSLQYTVTFKLPKGLTNRYFENWYTWEARTLKDGRKEFIIGAIVDPLTELSFSKGVELFTEGIPAVIIQVAAAVFRGGSSPMELISLAISLVVCGFTSAQISYDFDTE